jgi:hypothetical protein
MKQRKIFLLCLIGLLLSGGVALAATPSQESTAVSPYLWGVNLSLYDAKDAFLRSASTAQFARQLHVQMIRFPYRGDFAVTTAAAQKIKEVGAVPLLILRYDDLDANQRLVRMMNGIFGTRTVYYEYSNERDLPENGGIQVDAYTASWNEHIPPLKKLAPHAQFIGPVNFQYNAAYLASFVAHAQPRPDAVSWHEYTCDPEKHERAYCLSHIDNWTSHISGARQAMRAAIGMELPIMITEWNWSPNPKKSSLIKDDAFLEEWTMRALQTLIKNRVFAAHHYVLSNNEQLALLAGEKTLTGAARAF